jgi:hypothetical protein
MPNVNNDKAVKPSSSGKSAASNPSQSASERERDVDVFHALATNPDLKFNFHPKLTSWRFELAVLKASLTKENPDASRLVKIFTTMRDELLNITMRRPLIAEGIRSAMSDERLNALVPTRSEVDYGKTQVALLAALNHMGEIGNDQVSQNIQGKISELTARIQKKDAPIEVMFDALLLPSSGSCAKHTMKTYRAEAIHSQNCSPSTPKKTTTMAATPSPATNCSAPNNGLPMSCANPKHSG